MKRFTLLIGIPALAASLALAQAAAPVAAQIAARNSAQASVWTSDQAHSEVNFSIKHMSLSTVRGRFGNVAATILLNPADIAKSAVTATIDVSTIDTGVPGRDDDLKSSSFFDVDKFPTASFAGTSVARSAGGLIVQGNLTLHGITRPVVLDVEGPTTPIASARDRKLHAGYTATTTLSRTAFGIGTAYPAALIGDQVKLAIDLEVVKQ